MFHKIASAQELLRKLQEKQAGIPLPVVAGAALLGGAHIMKKGLEKGHEYKAGFQPGYIPGSQG
jgi:hypothetical protein